MNAARMIDCWRRGSARRAHSRAGRRRPIGRPVCRAWPHRTGRAGRRTTTRSPVRVGCAMSAVLSGPLGMYRASAFVYARSIIIHPSGWPSPVQSSGSASARKDALIWATVSALVGRGDLGEAARQPDRGPPGSDTSARCRLPSTPWPCRSSRPQPAGSWRSAAWKAIPGRRAPCWRRSPGTAAPCRDRTRQMCCSRRASAS